MFYSFALFLHGHFAVLSGVDTGGGRVGDAGAHVQIYKTQFIPVTGCLLFTTIDILKGKRNAG